MTGSSGRSPKSWQVRSLSSLQPSRATLRALSLSSAGNRLAAPPRSKAGFRALVAGTILVLVAVLAYLAGCGQGRRSATPDAHGSGQAAVPGAAFGNKPLPDLVKLVKPAVVVIEVQGRRSGNGFVVDRQGTRVVVTNYHVVTTAHNVEFVFRGDVRRNATAVVAAAPGFDLILLSADVPPNVAPLRLADKLPDQGERVVAFGSPLGFYDSVSDGIVAAIRSEEDLCQSLSRGQATRLRRQHRPELRWVQNTAPIASGDSGGPLVNLRGEVIGVISEGMNWSYGQHLNFAVAVTELRQLLESAPPKSDRILSPR
jgi:S1-C subfamily serine protease